MFESQSQRRWAASPFTSLQAQLGRSKRIKAREHAPENGKSPPNII